METYSVCLNVTPMNPLHTHTSICHMFGLSHPSGYCLTKHECEQGFFSAVFFYIFSILALLTTWKYFKSIYK